MIISEKKVESTSAEKKTKKKKKKQPSYRDGVRLSGGIVSLFL